MLSAVGAVSERIATATTNHNTGHPLVTAAYASTMHFLSGGRFSLGLGRGIDVMFDALGIPRIKTAQLEDFVGLMRGLWRGETVPNHDGPVGKFPMLRLDPECSPQACVKVVNQQLDIGADGVTLHGAAPDERASRTNVASSIHARQCKTR